MVMFSSSEDIDLAELLTNTGEGSTDGASSLYIGLVTLLFILFLLVVPSREIDEILRPIFLIVYIYSAWLND